jgi:uncharacterized repeat protein (TIGR01451 family)
MKFIKQNAVKSARRWGVLGLVLALVVLMGTPMARVDLAQQLFTLEVDVVSPSPTATILVTPPPGFGPIPCPPSSAINCTTQYPAGTVVTVTATSGIPVLGHNWISATYVAGPPLGTSTGFPPNVQNGCIWTTNTCSFIMPAYDLEIWVEIMEPKDPISELGDAPDSSNHHGKAMDAYPNVSANFPTVFNSGIPGDFRGPVHLHPNQVARLGPTVTREDEADIFPPDDDGVPNIDPNNNVPDQDGGDDGLVLPATLSACGQIQLNYTVSVPGTMTGTQQMYVNVWLDYNRDGDWEDSFKCPLGPAVTGLATEWAVQNVPISVGPGPQTLNLTTPLFTAANLKPGDDMWVRITLSEQQAVDPDGSGPLNPNGSGPPAGYQYGETEDYLWKGVGLPPGVCDLKITKTVQPNPVPSGQQVTITLTVQNVGTAPCPPGPFPGTIVRDDKPTGIGSFTLTPATAPPGWQCGLGVPSGNLACATPNTLPVSYSATFTFTGTVTAPPGSQIQNCATVNNQNDPLNPANPGNNQSCVTINVIGLPPPPDLVLVKLLDGQLRVEQEATYVLRVANVGGRPTTGPIVVSDPLPSGLRFVSASGPGWSCAAQGQNVTCRNAGPIQPGQTSTILLRVRVAAPAGTQITNCATVETAGDANPANNRACHTGTVQR